MPSRASSTTRTWSWRAPLKDNRRVGRKVQAREPQIESRRRRDGFEMDGLEPHLRQLEGRRGARGDRARDRTAVVPKGRKIARLDLDALGSPRPGLAQRPILERHGASGHDEAVDRDVERDTARSRAEEVGDVEIVRAAHDADRRALQHGIGDREVPSQQRERPHARVESLDGDEERLVIALEELEPGNGDTA